MKKISLLLIFIGPIALLPVQSYGQNKSDVANELLRMNAIVDNVILTNSNVFLRKGAIGGVEFTIKNANEKSLTGLDFLLIVENDFSEEINRATYRIRPNIRGGGKVRGKIVFNGAWPAQGSKAFRVKIIPLQAVIDFGSPNSSLLSDIQWSDAVSPLNFEVINSNVRN